MGSKHTIPAGECKFCRKQISSEVLFSVNALTAPTI